MQIIRNIHLKDSNTESSEKHVIYQDTVLIIGNFDGIHKAHRSILEFGRKIADQMGKKLALMSFYPHTKIYFRNDGKTDSDKNSNYRSIYPFKVKFQLLRSLGVDILFLSHFDKNLRKITAEDFIIKLLINKLKIYHLITGYNFTFGFQRRGNTELLHRYAKEYGFKFSEIKAFKLEGKIVSSSLIRSYLQTGKVRLANELLDSNYQIVGRVKAGAKRGRLLGFPTCNIHLNAKFCLLKLGVYIAKVFIHPEENCDNKINLYNLQEDSHDLLKDSNNLEVKFHHLSQDSTTNLRKDSYHLIKDSYNKDSNNIEAVSKANYSESSKSNKEFLLAVCNFGIRPTIDQEADSSNTNFTKTNSVNTHILKNKIPILEVYILDFDQDLYGKKLTVEFLDFVRAEKKFDNLEQLKAQISQDIKFARNYFGNFLKNYL